MGVNSEIISRAKDGYKKKCLIQLSFPSPVLLHMYQLYPIQNFNFFLLLKL